MCRHCVLSEPQLVRTTHRRPGLLRFVEIRFCALFFFWVAQAFVAHLLQLVRPETPIPQMADCESVAWQGRPHLKMQIGCQAWCNLGSCRYGLQQREASSAGVRASVCSGPLSTLRAVSRRNYVRNRSLAFTCVLLEHGLKSVKNILQLKPTHETCKIQLVHVEGIECRVWPTDGHGTDECWSPEVPCASSTPAHRLFDYGGRATLEQSPTCWPAG
jgi:hypothetical protein